MKTETAERLWTCRWAAVFLAAFALRAAFLLQWSHLPYLGALSADAWAYDRWAREIVSGGLLRHAAFYQSPFYPYLLALSYKLFGHTPVPVLWLQVAADSVTCLIAARLGERAFGRGAGLAAGLLCAFYRPFIFAAAVPGKETFAVFSTALFALLALRAGEGGRRRDWLFCGLAGGWAALLRSNTLLLLPAALVWAWRAGTGKKILRNAALPLLLGAALPILPATLHNFLASRDLVLINSNGGFTFFLGNSPGATGTGIYPPGFSSNPVLEETQPAMLAEAELGRPLKPSEVSGYWLRRALSFIAANPAEWLRLTAARFFFFWNRYEIPDNYDLQFIAANFRVVLGWPLASFALAGCLGAAGLFLCRGKEASGLLAFLFCAYFLSVLPFWVTDRYRLPALVFLLPAAGGFIAALLSRERGALRALWALPLAALCLLPPPFDLRLAEGAGWAQLVTVYAETGNGAGALESLRRAAAADPAALTTEIAAAAALDLERRGLKKEAAALLAAADEARK